MIRIYEQTPATHSGIVIVEDGEIYICEIDFHSYFSYDVKVSTMTKFMKKQWQYIGIIPVRKEIPLKLKDIDSIKCKFDVTMGFFPLRERIYCSTLVYRLLLRYGVYPWNGAEEHKVTPKTYHTDPSMILLDYAR